MRKSPWTSNRGIFSSHSRVWVWWWHPEARESATVCHFINVSGLVRLWLCVSPSQGYFLFLILSLTSIHDGGPMAGQGCRSGTHIIKASSSRALHVTYTLTHKCVRDWQAWCRLSDKAPAKQPARMNQNGHPRVCLVQKKKTGPQDVFPSRIFSLFSAFAPSNTHPLSPLSRHAAELSGDVRPLLVFQIAPET